METYTVCYEDSSRCRLGSLMVIAFVKINDTDGGVVRESSSSAEAIKIGMSVEAVLKPAGKLKWGLSDILHFRPV